MKDRLYFFLWHRVNDKPGDSLRWRLWAAWSFAMAGLKHWSRTNRRMALSQWRTAMKMLFIGCTCLLLSAAPLSAAPPIFLEWDGTAPAYKVYERTGPATAYVYAPLGTVTVKKFALGNPTPGAHAYVVTATDNIRETAYSEAAILPALPATPLNVRVVVEIVIPPQ